MSSLLMIQTLVYPEFIDSLCTDVIILSPIKFFTKGIIVPSPWAAPETRKVPQISKNSKLSYCLCYFLILVGFVFVFILFLSIDFC